MKFLLNLLLCLISAALIYALGYLAYEFIRFLVSLGNVSIAIAVVVFTIPVGLAVAISLDRLEK